MKIKLSNPRGFCAGVHRAINIVDQVLRIYGPPIYVKHKIVHNDHIITQLSNKGVVFIEQINDVPNGSVLIFSAHGVSKKIKEQAIKKKLIIFDATCPLVSKVHMKVSRASFNGMEIIVIGHAGHPEVEGTIGQCNHPSTGLLDTKLHLVESEADARLIQVQQPNNLFLVTQTTLSMDYTSKIIKILRQRFPKILIPKKHDICYATSNRQDALKHLILSVDIVFVVGSKSSSNSNRLYELAYRSKKPAYLINQAEDIQKDWLLNVNNVGITAGASTPDILVYQVLEKLRVISFNDCSIEEVIWKKEDTIFNIPKILTNSC